MINQNNNNMINEFIRQLRGFADVDFVTIPSNIDEMWQSLAIRISAGDNALNLFVCCHPDKVIINQDIINVFHDVGELVEFDKAYLILDDDIENEIRYNPHMNFSYFNLMGISRAIEIFNPNYWPLCPYCQNAIVGADKVNAINNRKYTYFYISGKCPNCGENVITCMDCDIQLPLKYGESVQCDCQHLWQMKNDSVIVKVSKI
jgi:hypothetical protein